MPEPSILDPILSLLPRGVAWSRGATKVRQLLSAIGDEADRVIAAAKDIAELNLTPDNASTLIEDWERICGITPDGISSISERQDIVVAHLRTIGNLPGADIPGIFATRFGYDASTVTIGASSRAFIAGDARAGDRLNDSGWTSFCVLSVAAAEPSPDQVSIESAYAESLAQAHERIYVDYTG